MTTRTEHPPFFEQIGRPPRSLVVADDLLLPLDAVTQKFAVLAQSGAGKTYTALKLAEEMLRLEAQVIALDPVGVWWGLRSLADGRPSPIKLVIFGGSHADVPISDRTGAQVAQVIVEQGISAVVDVSEFTTAESTRFVADFAEGLLHVKKKQASAVHLFMEEAQLFAPQNPEPSEGKMLNRVERLLKIGRNFGVGWTLVSQQPQAVHKRCLNQAGCLFALRTLGKHEKKAITEWVSDKARSDAELDLLRNLPSLETGEAFVWSPSWLKVAKKVRVAKRMTFDSSATPEVGTVKAAPKVADLGTLVPRLREAMATAAAEVEANDPAVLKKRIADLERQLKDRPEPSARVEYALPPVAAKLVREVAAGADKVRADLCDIEQRVQGAISSIDTLSRYLRQLDGMLTSPAGGTGTPTLPSAPPLPTPNRLLHPDSPTRPKSLPEHPDRLARSQQDDALNKGARAILVALASRDTPLSRTQIATLAGLSPDSGTFATYLSQLRQGLYVEDTKDRHLILTGRGTNFLRSRNLLPKRAATTDELLALWEAKLTGGAKTMLRILVGLGRNGVLSRSGLAQAAGLSAGSGTFATYLSQLHANGLIVKQEGVRLDGQDAPAIAPSPTFFP